MNDVIREWLQKAEADLLTAGRELQVTEMPNYDAVCFHAQQCIEKLMKAVLISQNQLPPRTHDLVRLDELVRRVVPEWSWPISDLRLLDRAAVDYRYPGEAADSEQAQEVFAVAVALRARLAELF